MVSSQSSAGKFIEFNGDIVKIKGDWTSLNLSEISKEVASILNENAKTLDVHAENGFKMDTNGALLLHKLIVCRNQQGKSTLIHGLERDAQGILAFSQSVYCPEPEHPKPAPRLGLVEEFVQGCQSIAFHVKEAFTLFGGFVYHGAAIMRNPRKMRIISVLHHFEYAGINALFIIGLISLVVGAIITQQGIFHMRRFGAEIYIIDMVALLTFREIAVIMTAVMIAGRSGSAFTAELGSMKMREEMDALRVMGVDPIEALILPRLLSLVLAFPLLTFFSALMSCFGAYVVAVGYADMSPGIVLERIRGIVDVKTVFIGLVKAPVMALVIGVIASYEGLRVEGSAESLGHHTTAAVVKSIFLVIIVDGIFAILFSFLGI